VGSPSGCGCSVPLIGSHSGSSSINIRIVENGMTAILKVGIPARIRHPTMRIPRRQDI
jgi:hypothetical protein